MGSISHSEGLPIIWHDSADTQRYEQVRVGRVFNQQRPARYPRAVVEAETEQHIVQAVRLAIELDCRVSVRSGGHSWAAWSGRDDAIRIDLAKWNHISLDENTGIVSVSPSTTGPLANGYLSKLGYIFPGGHCPDVGLGGFLLQGGMGWNCKNWGWACENIVVLDVVIAEGKLIRVDNHQNSELLFAAKGAGPGFPAIVTKFHLKVRKAYRAMLASTYIYSMAKYDEVMNWIIEASPGYDESAEIVAAASTMKGLGFDHICLNVHIVVFKDTEEEAKKALAPANQSRPDGVLTAGNVILPTFQNADRDWL